jgi:hypothetical protein
MPFKRIQVKETRARTTTTELSNHMFITVLQRTEWPMHIYKARRRNVLHCGEIVNEN